MGIKQNLQHLPCPNFYCQKGRKNIMNIKDTMDGVACLNNRIRPVYVEIDDNKWKNIPRRLFGGGSEALQGHPVPHIDK